MSLVRWGCAALAYSKWSHWKAVYSFSSSYNSRPIRHLAFVKTYSSRDQVTDGLQDWLQLVPDQGLSLMSSFMLSSLPCFPAFFFLLICYPYIHFVSFLMLFSVVLIWMPCGTTKILLQNSLDHPRQASLEDYTSLLVMLKYNRVKS